MLRVSFLRRFTLSLFVLPAFCAGLAAEDAPPAQPPAPETAAEVLPEHWWDQKWATGGINDLGSARKKLEDRGCVFELTYNGEARSNFKGGINTDGATEYLGNINASFDLFTDKFGLYPGGEFYIRYENVHGEGISTEHVGDIQLLSSIDAKPFDQISECFYRHSLLNDHLHFKVGKQDGTGDFIALKYGADFSHSAFGCISNIPLPRFHNYALAAVASYDATSWFSFASGVYDGRSTGKTSDAERILEHAFHDFSISEMTFRQNLSPTLPGIYRIGAWHLRKDLSEVGSVAPPSVPPISLGSLSPQFRNDFGVYMDFDQMIFKKNPAPDDDQGLAAFGQYSWSPDDRNVTPRYIGGGLRYKGTFSGRDADSVRAGLASVIFADRLRHTQGKTQESAIELYYKIQATKFMYLQPDFQYIVKPGGNHRDAVTGGIRFQVAF